MFRKKKEYYKNGETEEIEDFLNKAREDCGLEDFILPYGRVGEYVGIKKKTDKCEEELSDYVKKQLIISEKLKDDLAKEGLSYVTNTWLNNWLGITIKEFFILIEDETQRKCLVEDCLNERLGYTFLCGNHWEKYNSWKRKQQNLWRK